MSVRGREAPTTPPSRFASSSTRARFSFFWIPRPADTTTSAEAMSMSLTSGRSIRRNLGRAFAPSIVMGTRATAPAPGGGEGRREVVALGRVGEEEDAGRGRGEHGRKGLGVAAARVGLEGGVVP